MPYSKVVAPSVRFVMMRGLELELELCLWVREFDMVDTAAFVVTYQSATDLLFHGMTLHDFQRQLI